MSKEIDNKLFVLALIKLSNLCHELAYTDLPSDTGEKLFKACYNIDSAARDIAGNKFYDWLQNTDNKMTSGTLECLEHWILCHKYQKEANE